MSDNRVVYLGKDEAIERNDLVGFTHDDISKIEQMLLDAGEHYLAHKFSYANGYPYVPGLSKPGRKRRNAGSES